jgi:hypothetical protein
MPGSDASTIQTVNLAGTRLPNTILSASQTEMGDIRVSIRDQGGMEVSLLLDSHGVVLLSEFVRGLEETIVGCCEFQFKGIRAEGVNSDDALEALNSALRGSGSDMLLVESDSIIKSLGSGVPQDVRFARPPSAIALSKLRDYFVLVSKIS